MKVAAHPLIVAAALGLLGPAALVEDEKEEKAPCAHCDEQLSEPGETAFVAIPDEAPSAEDFARVEAAWHAAVLALPDDIGVA